jgi:hypothetical protein
MRFKILFITLAALSLATAVFADDGRWLNVHVTEAEDNTNVKVHLPLNLVLSVLGGIDFDGFEGGKVHIHTDDVDVDWVNLISSLKDAPDGEYVTVDSDEADVVVTKVAEGFKVHVDQKRDEMAKVDINIPASLINAFHVDENDNLDVAALLRAFDELPNGNLITVDSAEANVRVWIE